MKRSIIFLLALALSFAVNAQITKPEVTEVWEPEPRVVNPGETADTPPSDAIVLFDGSNLSEWTNLEGGSPGWKVENGVLTVVGGAGDIKTRREFGDVQLHIEFRTPGKVEGEGQGRGNSGLFFHERYEVQILDSYENRTYSNGQAGSIYKQYPPLVNASRPPGEWQTYDVVFIAPRFNSDGMRISPGLITVFHNGVLIQHASVLQGTTEYIGMPKNVAHGEGSIKLQDHGNPVSYRNIWVRRLD